ncbi:MAG TPA: hypothetical protein VNW99_12775 [Cytophagaceae bacterium]|jgi:hypothetical protein|nr:hypothetical protein [Cytophagaceae bacterium]
MKNFKLNLIGSLIIAMVFLQNCKKEPDPKPAKANDNDQAGTTEVDGAMDDVNNFINNKIGGGSSYRMAAYNLPCGVVSIDSTTSNAGGHKIYKVNYGGSTPCGYKYKSGQVSFELRNQTAFNIAGASFLVTFTDYTVEVKATGSIIKLNGSMNVTNQSGGYIWQSVTAAATIIHKIRGSVNITFSDNTVRPRSYFQLRTWASTSAPNDWSGLSLTIAGDTTIGGASVIEIGKTKDAGQGTYAGGYDYNTSTTNNFVWKNCGGTWAGPYKLTSGLARMNVTIPLISPTYIDMEGGYYWNYTVAGTPTKPNDCTSNSYKITTVLGTNTSISYQLY